MSDILTIEIWGFTFLYVRLQIKNSQQYDTLWQQFVKILTADYYLEYEQPAKSFLPPNKRPIKTACVLTFLA